MNWILDMNIFKERFMKLSPETISTPSANRLNALMEALGIKKSKPVKLSRNSESSRNEKGGRDKENQG